MSTARTARATRTLVPTPEVFRVRKFEWKSMAVMMRGAQRDDGKFCAVLVQTDGPVLALETDNPNGSALDVFAGHAHAVVLEHPVSLGVAVDAAERYLDRWLKHELEEPDNCDCGTIGAPPKAPPRTGSKRRSHA